jgi:hypothetical protein
MRSEDEHDAVLTSPDGKESARPGQRGARVCPEPALCPISARIFAVEILCVSGREGSGRMSATTFSRRTR